MKALLKPVAIASLVMAFLGLLVVHGSGTEPWTIRLSNNPILKDAQGNAYDMGGPWWYADPEIHRFDGTFWVYATRSAPYERQLNLDCFSSDDLVSWTKHEAIIDEASLPDSWRCFWAPTVARKDGYYYLLVGTNDLNLGSATNEVSVGDVSGMYLLRSESPKGPFSQFMGKNVPLIQDNYFGAQAIDANLFLDDDNTMYLVYGGWTTCLMAKFRDDMTGFEPLGEENWKKHNDPNRDAHELNHFMDYFVHLTNFGGRGATNNLKLGELNYNMGFLGTNEYLEEGPIIYKFDGYYYLMYSVGGWTGDTYGLRYAIAKSPMGPYTTISGRFLQTRYSVGARGTGHHSMVYIEENGTWLNTYHRRPIGGGRDDRYMAMDVAHLYEGEINLVAYDPLRPAGERVFIDPIPTKVKLFEPTIPTIYWSSDRPLPKNLAGYAQNEHKIGRRPRYSASGQRAPTTQAAHAFDAGINTRSYWESDGAKPGHWLCVDFGEATTYNEIHVYFNQLGPDEKSISHDTIIQFQKSDDGKTWTDLVFTGGRLGRALSPMERERRDGSYFFVRQAFNPAHSSRHLRLYFPGGQVAGVHELEVYNIASVSQLEALQNAGAKINEISPGAIPPPLSATKGASSNPNPNPSSAPSAATATPRPAGAARPVESLSGPISAVKLNAAGDFIGPMAVSPGGGMQGSTDPYAIRDGGYYYYARTENETSVTVSKARRLEDIGKVGKTTVWKPDFAQFPHLRSPRLHKVGNKWYLYVSASSGDGHRDNRNTPLNLWNDDYHFGVYALEASSPLGPFEFRGLVTKAGQWAADGTILAHPSNGKNYFVWSGRPDEDAKDAKEGESQMRPRYHKQALYIAEMVNPWTLKGERSLISEPTLDFEKGELNNAQVAINEGPAVAIRDDAIYIFYSANAGTDVHSSIGMLKTGAKSDPLAKASWAKSKNPVFWGGDSTTIDNAEGVFYVRQPCLTKSPDGKEDWLLYQAGARSYGNAVGNPANATQMRQYLNSKKDRSVRLQKIVWRNGVPSFAAATIGSAELAGNAAMRAQVFKRPSGTAGNDIYIIEAEDATITGVINPDDKTTADVDFKGLRAKTGIVGQWQRGGNEETAGPQDGARGGFGTYWNASNGLAVRLGKDGAAKFEIKVAKAGIYELSVIGVALEYGAKQIITVNGSAHEMTHALYSQRYGGLFTPQSLPVKLNVGNNVITITNKPGSLGAVIDYIYLGFLTDAKVSRSSKPIDPLCRFAIEPLAKTLV